MGEALASLDASFLSLHTATFSLCPHMGFPLCTRLPDVPLWVQISLFYEDTTPTGLGPTLQVSFQVYPPLYRPYLQIQSRSWVLGIRASTQRFGGGGGETRFNPLQ